MQPRVGPPESSSGLPSKDARQIAMFAHLSPLFLGILGPLLIWLLKKDDDPFIDEQGKEALNFHISVMIYAAACIPLVFIFIGIFALLAVGIGSLVLAIIAGIKANEGEHYRYPLTIRLIH